MKPAQTTPPREGARPSRLAAWREWLVRVESEELSAQRRARVFIPLVAVMALGGVMVVGMFLITFRATNPYSPVLVTVLGGVVALGPLSIVLARRGWLNWAGAIVGGGINVVLVAGYLMYPSVVLSLGWFFGVGVLLASYAMEARRLVWMGVFAQACVGVSFGMTAQVRVGVTALWPVLMSVMLWFVVLASLLHARSTERLFLQQLQVARDLELARREAEQANRAKSAFLANMSHELRTPLNAILGYSEMLTEEHEGDALTLSDLDRIHVSGSHLLGLINDILDLSKIEAGKMDLLIERVDVVAFVEEVVSASQQAVARGENRLMWEVDPSCGEIASDRTKLRQVMVNLIANAAKFTREGVITLRVQRVMRGRRMMLEVVVSDTGVGMSAEALSRVFNEFEQADPSTTREHGGTGLGLSLCRRICHMLEGGIEAQSQEGVGTTFTFSVSVAHSEASLEVATHLAVSALERESMV